MQSNELNSIAKNNKQTTSIMEIPFSLHKKLNKTGELDFFAKTSKTQELKFVKPSKHPVQQEKEEQEFGTKHQKSNDSSQSHNNSGGGSRSSSDYVK